MPKQSWSSDRNQGRYLLTDKRPSDLQCVRVFVPNDQYFFNLLIGVLNRLGQQIWYMRDDAHSAKEIAALWDNANLATFGSGFTSCSGEAIPNTTGNQTTISGDFDFDYFLELLKELDMKFSTPDGTIYEPVIPLQPCGCGDSSTTSSGQNPVDGITGGVTGNVGNIDTSVTTKCDLIGTGLPWMRNQVDNVVGNILSGVFVIDVAGGILDDLVVGEGMNDIVDYGAQVVQELNDPDFIIALENAAAKYWNDPVIPPVSRLALLKFAWKVPAVFEGAPMQSAWLLWAASQDMEIFNQQLRLWAGTGNYSDCLTIAERSGTPPPYNPADHVANLDDVFTIEGAEGTYTARVFPMGTGYQRFSQSPAIPPYDFTGANLVGAGIVLDSIDNITGNSPNPALQVNDGTGTVFTAPNDLAGISLYHVSAFVAADVPAGIRGDVEDRIVNRVSGIPVDDRIFFSKPTISDPDLWFGASDIDSGSATVAYVWTLELDPSV